MPPKRNTKARSARGGRVHHPREWPEWIDRLRRRVESGSPAKRAWAEKAGSLVLELMDLPEESLTEAGSTPDSWTAMLRAMSAPQTLKRLQAAEPLAPAFLRGIAEKRRLVKDNGGVFSAERTAELLDITSSEVNRRRSGRKLLGLMFRRKGYMYPAWQFDVERGATVPGLEGVLSALADHDEWMQT